MKKDRVIVSSLAPVGDMEEVRGRMVHTVYENGHVAVAFDWNEDDDSLFVVASFPDGFTKGWVSSAAWPNVECAQIAAEVGFKAKNREALA